MFKSKSSICQHYIYINFWKKVTSTLDTYKPIKSMPAKLNL